ncbi:MAG: P1 family peptidase [Actinobacteria bacterium]|nr:P1 family peptidase [Actinomycetota bacterium]
MALGLDDLRVGVWTSPHAPTGTTVLLPPEGSLGAMAVRGASPGTREAMALGPNGKLTTIHAAVLSGGSAFGLATADGVVSWLAARGIGYDIGVARVPIVGAAIILDQGIAFPEHRPDAAAGVAACDAASADDPPEGAVGAGTGATVAKTGGLEHCWRGGQGWAVRASGEVVVGALVINNAVGEVIAEDGQVLAASRAPADVVRFPEALPFEVARENGPTASTVIGAIVTNARLDKLGAYRVADLGHSGIVRAVRPAHTQYDGDALFCLATQRVETHVDLVAALAADAVAEAARHGPLAAHGAADIPGLADAR